MRQIPNKALQNSPQAKNVFNKAVLSQTVVRNKLGPNMVVSKLANLNPTTAVINKAIRVAKAVKRVTIDKGLDLSI